MDFFGARYFGSAQGRFTSPDEPLIDQFEDDPQSWNLYSYVRNNPLLFTDPTGQACNANWEDDDRPGPTCQQVREDDKKLKEVVVEDKFEEPLSPFAQEVLRQTKERVGGSGEALTFALAKFTFENAVLAATGAAVARTFQLLPAATTLGIFKNTKVVINFAHRVMNVRPGHLPPPGTEAEIQRAVEGAIRTGHYVLKSNRLIEGTTQINGVAVGFKGRIVEGVARISTVFTKR